MTTTYGPLAIWGAIAVVAVVTYAIRFSFVGLFGRVDAVPPRLNVLLRYVPAAVLAALVLPAFVALDGGAPDYGRLGAGAAAAVAAWRTGSVVATLAVGMAALWALRALVPA